MIKRLILVLLALGLTFGGIFGWKYYQMQRQAAQAATPPPPASVAATRVRTETWQSSLHAIGSLVAIQGIQVNNEVPGQVEDIAFESGAQIEKGEILIQLDDSVDQAELAGLIADQRLAELQFRRMAKLFREQSVSRAEFDEAKARLERTEAQVASKQALINKKRIRAPFSGSLGIRQVDLGDYLAPGSPIVPLQALDPIYVDYSLPEQHFDKLAVGQQVLLEVPAYPSDTFEGRIVAINPGIDRGTRTVRVRALLNNPHFRLRPGMFAEVRTVLAQRQDVLTLPRTAVTYNPYGDAVFVIQEQEQAWVVQRKQVTTGQIRNGRVEIIKGLKQGQRVVSAGQVKLRNGQRVTISESNELSQPGAKS
jgi:membrane fusion protein (multidrug efflux system)